MENNKIEYFDPTKLKDNFFMYVVGMRRSGKTTLIKDLIYNSKFKWDEVYLISETADLSNDYDDYINPSHIFKLEEAEKVLTHIETEQRKIKNKEMRKKVLLLLDDVITAENKERWDKIAFMGRHLKVYCILLSQSMKAISPLTRRNTDYALFSTSRNYDDIEAFVRAYISGIYGDGSSAESLKNSINLYNEITKEDYAFIFIDNSAKGKNMNDIVFKYKASDNIPKFNIYSGAKQKLENQNRFNEIYKDIKNKISNNNITKNGNKRGKSSSTNEPSNPRVIRDKIISVNILYAKQKPRSDLI